MQIKAAKGRLKPELANELINHAHAGINNDEHRGEKTSVLIKQFLESLVRLKNFNVYSDVKINSMQTCTNETLTGKNTALTAFIGVKLTRHEFTSKSRP